QQNPSLAPRAGFEPATLRLTAGCSAVELPRNIGGEPDAGEAPVDYGVSLRTLRPAAGLLIVAAETGRRKATRTRPQPRSLVAAFAPLRLCAFEPLSLCASYLTVTSTSIATLPRSAFEIGQPPSAVFAMAS